MNTKYRVSTTSTRDSVIK